MNFLYDIAHALQNRSRSFKVTDFGTNQKLIYDFLLVISTNLPAIVLRVQVIGQIFVSESGVPHFNAIVWGDSLPISP